MTSFLKKYNIELKTVGPVFIGSGKIINKKEAIFRKASVIIILSLIHISEPTRPY